MLAFGRLRVFHQPRVQLSAYEEVVDEVAGVAAGGEDGAFGERLHVEKDGDERGEDNGHDGEGQEEAVEEGEEGEGGAEGHSVEVVLGLVWGGAGGGGGGEVRQVRGRGGSSLCAVGKQLSVEVQGAAEEEREESGPELEVAVQEVLEGELLRIEGEEWRRNERIRQRERVRRVARSKLSVVCDRGLTLPPPVGLICTPEWIVHGSSAVRRTQPATHENKMQTRSLLTFSTFFVLPA